MFAAPLLAVLLLPLALVASLLAHQSMMQEFYSYEDDMDSPQSEKKRSVCSMLSPIGDPVCSLNTLDNSFD